MNIILTGMRGSGKTSLGKRLAEKLGWVFIDIDHEIESKLNKKIDQYVKEEGWDAFRKIEKQVTSECAQKDQTVISTGGGTLMDEENANLLKQNGHVVLLERPLEKLRENLKQSHERPSLTGEQNALDELQTIWNERKDRYYAVADTVFNPEPWPNVKGLIQKLPL